MSPVSGDAFAAAPSKPSMGAGRSLDSRSGA
jgi:hypothetical protein